jgi:flavin reductase ActVB
MMTTASMVEPAAFREAMARFASGVTVVATRDRDGKPVAFTASAFSSLSLEPPLILVCLDKRADCFPAFQQADHVTVSILAADQAELARRFAAKGTDKFADVAVEPGALTGLPLVLGAAVQLECRMYQRLEGGDHIILVGEVLGARSTDREPLLHFNRQFGRFTDHEIGASR